MMYVFLTFPLGIFYFVFLITGLSVGISLTIIWIGIPILLLVGLGWWGLAAFERWLAISWLEEDIQPMAHPSEDAPDLLNRFKNYFTNPVTWKSLLYLFIKFPLGIFGFVVLVTFVSLTVSLIAMPILYQSIPAFPTAEIDFGSSVWYIDSMNDAMVASLFGFLLWPVTMHISNGLAWLNAKLARYLISVEPVSAAFQPKQIRVEKAVQEE
jgi:hypothetical protein